MTPFTVECLILKGLLELSLPDREERQIVTTRTLDEAKRLANEHSLVLDDRNYFDLDIDPEKALDLFKKRLNIVLRTCFALR